MIRAGRRRSRRELPVAVVTTARRSHADDLALRRRRYLLLQGLRLLCFVLAVALPLSPLWRGAFIVGAVVLPWFGVVAANAGPSIERRGPNAVLPQPAVEPLTLDSAPNRVIDST